MPENNKNIYVTDNIHESIAISVLEKSVISTEAFNRLHNILQNSTLFLTYPSNRTTRFSHSLGCMHLAGEIFRNGILNADKNTQVSFLNNVFEFIEYLQTTNSRESIIPIPHSVAPLDNLLDNLNEIALYRSACPSIIESSEHRYAFIIAYQSVRLAGLLHDVGQPPFSHVTEYAVKNVTRWVNSSFAVAQSEGTNLSSRQNYYKKRIEESGINGPGKAIHEYVGTAVASSILRDICDSAHGDLSTNLRIISNIALHMFKLQKTEADEFSSIGSMYRIVNGDLDADRLDYVARDMNAAGVGNGRSNYSRLISLFTLVHEHEVFSFVPSIRALKRIEEFFREYQHLYKYVIFHHRVAKTDGLLKRSVETLAKSYLKAEDKETALSDEMSRDISGLWSIMFHTPNPDEHWPDSVKQTYINWLNEQYIQWDDSWLLSVLRKEYIQLKTKLRTVGTLRENDQILLTQLTELLANKKNYFSLYKRADTFKEVDNNFLKSFEREISQDHQILLRMIERLEENDRNRDIVSSGHHNDIKPLLALLYWYNSIDDLRRIDEVKKGEYVTLRGNVGFFSTWVFHLIELGVFQVDFQVAERSLQSLRHKYALSDAFVEIKALKRGINSSFRIFGDSSTEEMADVSAIAIELARNSFHFPYFYAYIYSIDRKEPYQFKEMRRDFGNALWQEFSKSFLHRLRSQEN